MSVETVPASSATRKRRRVVKVSRSTVAAAQAQVAISERLGLPVAPATAKIAKIKIP